MNVSKSGNSTEIVLGVESIYIPFIISIVGMIGNFMTFVTIVKTDMRKNYANSYILVLLCSDTIVLSQLFVRFWFEMMTVNFVSCALAQYIRAVAVYASNLAIISLTMERFFAIVFPLHHMRNSHLNRWKIILCWLIPTILFSTNIFYALKTPSAESVQIKFSRTGNEKIKCLMDYERPYVDIIFHIPRLLFSFILTLIVVISVNVIITFKLKARNVFRSESNSREAQATSIILTAIPITYVILNTPYWIRQFMRFFMTNKASYGYINQHYFFTTISYYMFCMNFATNFVVYALISPNFRISFFKVWFCRDDPRDRSKSTSRITNATTVMRISNTTTSRSSGGEIDKNVIEEAIGMPKIALKTA